MASFLDELIRREREKADFLTRLNHSAGDSLAAQQHFLDAIVSPAVRSAFTFGEQPIGLHESSLARAFATESSRKRLSLDHLMIDRHLLTDTLALSNSRWTEQIASQLQLLRSTSFSEAIQAIIPESSTSLRNALAGLEASLPSFGTPIAQFLSDAGRADVNDVVARLAAESARLMAENGVLTDPTALDDEEVVVRLTAHLQDAVRSATRVRPEGRLRAFVEECLAIISRASRPVAIALLASLGTVLLWVPEGFVQDVTGELLAPARAVLITEIRKITRTTRHAPIVTASEVRVVVVDRLVVRRYPRRSDSPVVATLHLGDVVVAVRSSKDWTLVTYKDDDIVVTGWVFTRYAKKVTIPTP